MTTIALDENNDIIFDSDGSIAIIDGCDEIRQCIKQSILDNDINNFIGKVDFETLSALLTSTIAGTDGVRSLTSFSLNTDNTGCGSLIGIRVNFEAETDCGTISGVL